MAEAGIVIIGAGLAGVQLAASLRAAGYAKSITLIGNEPELPYQRPPLTKTFIKDSNQLPLQLRSPGFYTDNAINLQTGTTATTINPSRQTVSCRTGKQFQYTQLVLATGAKLRQLQLGNANYSSGFYLRTLADAVRLREQIRHCQKIAVIGGGFIGLELAVQISAMGKKVTIIEAASRILSRSLSAMLADQVANDLTRSGIDLLTATNITKITAVDDKKSIIQLTNQQVMVDLVIIGVGVEPETQLAHQAGIKIANGIKVNQYLETSQPDIYAIGDCVSFPFHNNSRIRLESIQNAGDQARCLAKNLTGTRASYQPVPWFWSQLGEVQIQITGNSADADEQVCSYTTAMRDKIKSVYHLRQGQLLAVESCNSPAEHLLARQLLQRKITPTRAVMASGDIQRIKAAIN